MGRSARDQIHVKIQIQIQVNERTNGYDQIKEKLFVFFLKERTFTLLLAISGIGSNSSAGIRFKRWLCLLLFGESELRWWVTNH